MALIKPEQLRSGSYSISGSFSGSFQGDGSNLTGIATDPFPYTGSARITGSLDLIGPFTTDSSISSPTSITFDINPSDADAEARLKWNDTEGTLDLGMGGGSATLQMGQELYYPKVVNKSGENLINGTLVMVDPAQPAQGNRLRVVRAITDGSYPSELIVGPLTEDVDNNQEGFATWFGYVRGMQLNDIEANGIKDPNDTWVEGTILYTNPNLDGGYTSSVQPAPSGKSSIAAVTAVNGQNINILVRPKLDTNVGSLHDVTDLTTSASYGDLFIKNGNIWSTGKTLSGSYELTGSLNATSITSSNLYTENELWTIELIDAQTVDFYAPYNLTINSYDTVVSASTVTFLDDGSSYTTGSLITAGSKITVTSTSATVINLNTSR